LPSIPSSLCTRCKGYKLLCGLTSCPILTRFRVQAIATTRLRGRELAGFTPPSMIVGERGYPGIRVYYMIPPGEDDPEKALYHDAPWHWTRKKEPLGTIIQLRSSMISAVLRADVKDPWALYERELSLAAVSLKPVDSEARLRSPPIPRLRFDGITKPIGPASSAEQVKITSNPTIPHILEKVIWDDLKAREAIIKLYSHGLDVYLIQRSMSLGLLGRGNSRRLVPTRWAITAIDDTISSSLRREIRRYPWINDFEIRHGEYLGNRFIVILYPGAGTFDWVEIWHPRGLWTRGAVEPQVWHLREDPLGRSTAEDGGFSAARIAVLEHLKSRRRSANAIILREILPEYYAPVGNWHIREHVRMIMKREPIKLQSLKDAINRALSMLSVDPIILRRKVPILRGVMQARLPLD